MNKAQTIVRALWQEGFAAYIVGGAVRDMLMGMSPGDIDICTSATPEEITAVACKFRWHTVAVGAAFGTVIVVVEGNSYEVTTFRREAYGKDSHRPERVEYSGSLTEDLARRDFTINALCLDDKGHIIDLYGGQEDLKQRVLRTVGEAQQRFAEDALRMFRAARFVAKLDFSPHADILPAIKGNLERVRGLSVERVRNELEQILMAPYAAQGLNLLMDTGLLGESCRGKADKTEYDTDILPELVPLKGLAQNPRHHKLDVWFHTLSVLEQTPAQPVLRWAALLHDIAKGRPGVRGLNSRGEISDHGHDAAGAELARVIFERLKLDRGLAVRATWLVRHHMMVLLPEEKIVKRWLKKRSTEFRNIQEFQEAIADWCKLARADRYAKHVPTEDTLTPVITMLWKMLQEVPFYPAQLAISGGAIAALAGSGPQVANLQRNLLERVQNRQLKNTAEELLQAVQHRLQRPKK